MLPGGDLPVSDFFSTYLVDKIVHFVLFLVFAVLFYASMPGGVQGNKVNMTGIILILVISLAYGLLIEILQKYVPGRDFEVADIIAGGAGTLTGLFFIIVKKNLAK